MPKRPALALIKEGNPGHRPKERLAGGVKLAPEAPPEPKWADVFPAVASDEYVKRLRGWAKQEWRRVVPVLDAQGLLSSVDLGILLDHCVAYAIARECYRSLSEKGLMLRGERGWQKNGATTILAQQRDRLKHTVVQLGLSPLSRDSLRPPEVSDDDAPFD